MAQSSSNTGLFVLLAAGAAAYYAYTQGWLSSLLGTSTASPATVVSAAPVTSTPAAGPVPVPTSTVGIGPSAVPTPAGGNVPIPAGVNYTPGSLGAAIAQSMANSGATAAQINASIAAATASASGLPAGSIAGIGRVMRGGYHWRRRSA